MGTSAKTLQTSKIRMLHNPGGGFLINKNKTTPTTKESLKSTIKTLVKLKDQGYLNESALVELLKFTCTLYIENEVERRVADVMQKNILNNFNRILQEAF